MVVVGVLNGVVDLCVAVDDLVTLRAMYPDHLMMEQVGDENVGWTYDGNTFSPPG